MPSLVTSKIEHSLSVLGLVGGGGGGGGGVGAYRALQSILLYMKRLNKTESKISIFLCFYFSPKITFKIFNSIT